MQSWLNFDSHIIRWSFISFSFCLYFSRRIDLLCKYAIQRLMFCATLFIGSLHKNTDIWINESIIMKHINAIRQMTMNDVHRLWLAQSQFVGLAMIGQSTENRWMCHNWIFPANEQKERNHFYSTVIEWNSSVHIYIYNCIASVWSSFYWR